METNGGGSVVKPSKLGEVRGHCNTLLRAALTASKLSIAPPPPASLGQGWSGPYLNRWAGINATQERTSYVSVEEAKAQALLDPKCGGLTRSREGLYTLRVGNKLNLSPSQEVSYVISERWTATTLLPEPDALLEEVTEESVWNTPVLLLPSTLPTERREWLAGEVARKRGMAPEEITINWLKHFVYHRGPQDLTDTHPARVATQLVSLSDVDQFVFQWRHLFVNEMRPRFMPDGWDPSFVEPSATWRPLPI
eukprot:NODE_1240_length_1220_cov_47.265585_g1013_i0.p1 GENE.NODE_1240_length_1220_cov_47.265585_g1013_i0~~NODE_1240_length_1220_cov_47.265585_g1013_i0.p1  ORF type:complete len:252 (-),score=57.23 NODE_1240_length_1220_cov_47.265585_g1013_i0:167-922(-)